MEEKQKKGLAGWWLEKWGNYSKAHPKAAKWIYQIFYFWVFSMSVTIFQYLAFTFLPYPYYTRSYLGDTADTYYGEAIAVVKPDHTGEITIFAKSRYGEAQTVIRPVKEE